MPGSAQPRAQKPRSEDELIPLQSLRRSRHDGDCPKHSARPRPRYCFLDNRWPLHPPQETDESKMKCSHSLQFNSVPDWADKYIAYSNLKKTIYQLEKEEFQGELPHGHVEDIEGESAALLRDETASDVDKIFIPMLDRELRKIVKFFGVKERELEGELELLLRDIERTEAQEGFVLGTGRDRDDDALMSDEEEDGVHRFGVESTPPTVRGTLSHEESLGHIFADPQRYNEAARERDELHAFPRVESGGSGAGVGASRPRGRRRSSVRSTEDRSAASPSGASQRPFPHRRVSSHLVELGDAGEPDVLAVTGDGRPHPRQRTHTWSNIFRRKSSRKSLGIVVPSGGPPDSGPASASVSLRNGQSSDFGGAGSSAFGGGGAGEGKMSIWTADHDYAIDVRITFKRRITDLFVSFSELKQFVSLNETGMKKILKKYDKIMKRDLKDRFLRDVVQHPFTAETASHLSDHLNTLSSLYAKVVTGGDMTQAMAQLQDHLREQVVWQRNTVWREMIGIERRAQGASLQNAVMGGAGGKTVDGEKPKPRRVLGVELPSWFGAPAVQLLVAFGILVVLLKVPHFRFFSRVEEQNCLAMLAFCTILWATEVIPLFVTSLLVPFLVVTLRVARTDDIEDRRMSAGETTKWIFSQMFAPNMCLLLGGFTLAAALSKYGVDKVLAQRVLRLAGTRPPFVLLAHMAVACFASMWISNVAAPVLMFSLIQPILRTLPSRSTFAPALIMGIALASNIGGQTSPIASPQNLIALQYMADPIGWVQWFAITLPVSGVSLLVIWLLLLWAYGSGRGLTIKRPAENRDGFSHIQYFISAVSVATITLWCLERNFEYVLGDMGVIAIVPMILFFGTGILTKEDFNNFLWTIVFLAMGGIALGKAVTSSGLLESLDSLIQELVQGMPIWKVLFSLLVICLVVATFISHTIAAVLLVPIAAQVGDSLASPHPRLLIMATTLTASAAMGLPVSGFPNMAASAQEDATGRRYVSVRDFLRVGVPASVLATAVVGSVGYLIMHVLGL